MRIFVLTWFPGISQFSLICYYVIDHSLVVNLCTITEHWKQMNMQKIKEKTDDDTDNFDGKYL